MCLQYKSFENTVRKGEIAHHEQFLLFPQCFLTICKTLCHFHKNQNCRLQTLSVWKSLKFVVWERVKSVIHVFGINSHYLIQIFVETEFHIEITESPSKIHCDTF